MSVLGQAARITQNQSSIYITFDDGPHPSVTPAVCEILREHSALTAFFQIGRFTKEYPSISRQCQLDGHAIGNHTFDHPNLQDRAGEEVEYQISSAQKCLEHICGRGFVRHFRAPYGAWSTQILNVVNKIGLRPVSWPVDPRDWEAPRIENLINEILDNARPSSIILLHDGCPPDEAAMWDVRGGRAQTLAALRYVVPALQARGFALQPLP
nr:chitooligosaccharide deacetylase [Azorhizobium caulinodans ORS 571]